VPPSFVFFGIYTKYSSVIFNILKFYVSPFVVTLQLSLFNAGRFCEKVGIKMHKKLQEIVIYRTDYRRAIVIVFPSSEKGGTGSRQPIILFSLYKTRNVALAWLHY
jgi:hypothetical protein